PLLRPGSTRPLPVWRVAVMASLPAAAATQALELIARAAGVPMRAGSPGATTAATIGVGGFGVATLMSCAAGVVLAVVLARLSKRPARTYAVTSIVLTAVSLLSPAFAYGAVGSTKVILASAHVL